MSRPCTQPPQWNRGTFDHAVQVHHEETTWWAECDDFPGFSAAADTRDDLIARVGAFIAEVDPDASWYLYEWFVGPS